ncbi:tribbles -like protein [Brachionus plicatilis]|uniref:Tribbles-like protein n=1 Tax=Brachionus plicatilis TaxID=10195 RepID=A0A3M7SAF3_BRAPC|nr:tribbles -like protein [Brachionus plicatilis]
MSTRLQLNRSLSLHLNGLSKDGQTSPPLDNQGSNLSPSIQPDIQSFSSLIKLSQQCSTQANSPNEDPNSSSNQTVLSDSNQELSQKCSTKGDFLLLESNAQVDCFNSAINTKNQRIYYWKKFDVKHYMKKLEAYFIMEGASDKIYKFSQIVLDSGTQSAGQASKWAYVFFEPHFGDLHSYMKEKKRLEESEAKHIYRQCVQAVMDCHDNGIIIRDIKLKKFVFLDKEKSQIGLANLEDCLILDEDATDDLIKSQQGCPAYVSPEVLNPSQSSYSGRLSDSWSLGIILYTLLIGRYPFHHPTITNLFAKIARGRFQVPPSVPLSLEGKLLLRSLIRVKPEERLYPSEILSHSWLKLSDSDNLNRFLSFENRFAGQAAKSPLGISLSAPGRLANDSSKKSSNGINNLMNYEEDRAVPEIKY